MNIVSNMLNILSWQLRKHDKALVVFTYVSAENVTFYIFNYTAEMLSYIIV